MDSSLQLSFVTTSGEKYSFTVPKVKPEVDVNIVKATMNKIITTNAIETKRGDLAAIDSANLFKVTKTLYTFA